MSRIVHFEFHAPDLKGAIAFYEQAFGWKITKWAGPHEYYLIETGEKSEPGINGGLMSSQDGQPRTVNTLHVANVDEAIKRIEAAGGTVVVPKMAIPGVGWLAYFKDPGGLIVGVMHPDPTAK